MWPSENRARSTFHGNCSKTENQYIRRCVTVWRSFLLQGCIKCLRPCCSKLHKCAASSATESNVKLAPRVGAHLSKLWPYTQSWAKSKGRTLFRETAGTQVFNSTLYGHYTIIRLCLMCVKGMCCWSIRMKGGRSTSFGKQMTSGVALQHSSRLLVHAHSSEMWNLLRNRQPEFSFCTCKYKQLLTFVYAFVYN